MNIEFLNSSATGLTGSLAHASWQGALAAIAVWLLCQCFPRLPASVKCWLWRLVLLKALLAFIWVHPIDLEVFAMAQPAPAISAPIQAHHEIIHESFSV